MAEFTPGAEDDVLMEEAQAGGGGQSPAPRRVPQPVTEGPPGAQGAAEPTPCLLPLPEGHPGMHHPREGC